ncbi:hypothetical protein [Chelativorans sp. Marseille-P2723]|uniref:hypothetical protein n=1 Tax=Chelativorans sp. Marseille-P2723 TaxID=2709133 RepID=UPI00156D8BA5|nr:hypothetical protein [Chelativorans sp. Marseille-P2723]
MSNDALFQLGMGPVNLDATQTEETVALRALERCMNVRLAVCQDERDGSAVSVAIMFCTGTPLAA